MLENAESAILNEVLGSLPGIFYMFDKTGRFVQWNRQFVQVSGYSDVEMLERHPLDFFQGDDRELIASRIAQTFEHGEADAQAHFISKNGAGRPYFFTGRRLYQQEEVYLLGVGFDLSRVQTAETERRRYHELLMAALNQSLSAILIARAPDGRIELANPAALAMRGGRSEDLTGIAIEEHSQRWQTFRPDGSPFPPEELPLSRAILKGETSKAEEVIVRDQGGKDHIVVANASPVRDADGSTIAGIVVFHDVTQEREALREVERANEELLAINRVLLRAVTATTHKEVFDAALKELTDLTGMDGGLVCLKEGEVFAVVASRGEVPCEHSRDCPMLCCKENRSVPLPLFLRSTAAIEEQKEVLESDAPMFSYFCAVPIPRKAGESGHLCLYSYRSVTASGRSEQLCELIAGQLGMFLDNLQLRQNVAEHLNQLENRVAERTAELKTKNEELEAFSGSISHDLRAPLRAVQGWARALREDYADLLPSGALDLVGRQEVAAMRMMEMIEDLLRLSRLSKHPLRLRNWDPAETIKEVWQMVIAADPAGNRARLLQSGDLPACEADPALLRQVLGNLLENALKFSRDKDMPQIKIQGWIESGECIYSIEDNGIGFNPAYARRIFQPFQRLHSLRHFEGNGIGLATVKRIITRHGGRIWAHSVPGEGATFFFALPVSTPALEEAAPTGKVR